MCQWCNLLMFVAFLYLYNSKEFLFSFGFGYFIKLWIYPLLFVAFFFRHLCIWGAPRTFDTLEPTLANFFIYTLSPTISNVTWLSLLLLILWFEAAASTPPSHLGLCFFPRYFGQDIFDMVSVRSAFVSETLWSNTLFRFLFCTIRVLLCCGLFLYVRPIKCIHCARTVNDTCCSCLPLLFFTVLPSIYNPFWPEIYFSVFRRFCWRS